MALPLVAAAAFFAVDAETPPAAGATPPAAADEGAVRQEAHAAAQAALSAGNRCFKAGDFTGALVEYQRAKSLYPEGAAKVEFNIAKTEEALGHEEAAADAFERFLDLPPTALVTALVDYREEASAALRRLSAKLGSVQLVARRDGLDVVVDEQPRGRTPLAAAIRVRPGHHLVVLADRGGRALFREEIDVAVGDTVQIIMEREAGAQEPDAGSRVTARATLQATGAAAGAAGLASPPAGLDLGANRADESSKPPVWKRWWFWTAAGAVVAAGVLTLVLSTDSSSCPAPYSCLSKMVPKPQ